MTDLNTLHAEALALKVEIARLTSEMQNRTAAMAAMVQHATGQHVTDAGTFTVSENNTYDESVMRAQLKPGQVARCEVKRLDKAIVKRAYPEVYAAAKKNNGVKVTL